MEVNMGPKHQTHVSGGITEPQLEVSLNEMSPLHPDFVSSSYERVRVGGDKI